MTTWKDYLEQVSHDLTKIIVSKEYDVESMTNTEYCRTLNAMKNKIFDATFFRYNSGFITDEEAFNCLLRVFISYMKCILTDENVYEIV